MSVATVYPLYVAKAERKGCTKEEVDELILWLTGYSKVSSKHIGKNKLTLKPSLRKLQK